MILSPPPASHPAPAARAGGSPNPPGAPDRRRATPALPRAPHPGRGPLTLPGAPHPPWGTPALQGAPHRGDSALTVPGLPFPHGDPRLPGRCWTRRATVPMVPMCHPPHRARCPWPPRSRSASQPRWDVAMRKRRRIPRGFGHIPVPPWAHPCPSLGNRGSRGFPSAGLLFCSSEDAPARQRNPAKCWKFFGAGLSLAFLLPLRCVCVFFLSPSSRWKLVIRGRWEDREGWPPCDNLPLSLS